MLKSKPKFLQSVGSGHSMPLCIDANLGELPSLPGESYLRVCKSSYMSDYK